MHWQTLGFEKNKRLFERLVEKRSLAHAYIFSGQDMIGKRTFALELAKLINTWTVDEQHNSDLMILSPSLSQNQRSIAIEDVRDAKRFISLSPYSSSYKILIVDNAHLMTDEAQNALLKVLEEPSASSLLFLISDSPQLLADTIVSRCQNIGFQTHAHDVVKECFVENELSQPQQDFLIQFAQGRIGLIKNIIVNKAYPELKTVVGELAQLVQAPIHECFDKVHKICESEDDLDKKILYWLLYYHTKINGPKTAIVLRNLLNLYSITRQSSVNRRLALENFVLALHT